VVLRDEERPENCYGGKLRNVLGKRGKENPFKTVPRADSNQELRIKKMAQY